MTGGKIKQKVRPNIEVRPVITCIKEIISTLKEETETVLAIVEKNLGKLLKSKIVDSIKRDVKKKRERDRQK